MKFKKRGDEIKKKSSPLKLQSQFQPNFAEMILVEIGSVVSEEKIFFNFIPPFFKFHNWSKSVKVQSS
jgi:hypothetical protein